MSSEATRRRILDATAALLREGAAGALGLEAVARGAGTAVPTVLRHFHTKDALISSALGSALEQMRAARPRVTPGDHLAAARVLAEEYEREAAAVHDGR